MKWLACAALVVPVLAFAGPTKKQLEWTLTNRGDDADTAVKLGFDSEGPHEGAKTWEEANRDRRELYELEKPRTGAWWRCRSRTRRRSRPSRMPRTMAGIACPICSLEDVLTHADRFECSTCGHEWEREAPADVEPAEVERVAKDANGNVLADGDSVSLIKDLKLRGSSEVLEQGTKAKNIRLVDGDHEIDCKIDGSAMALKACFVKMA
jgi:protein PhnA